MNKYFILLSFVLYSLNLFSQNKDSLKSKSDKNRISFGLRTFWEIDKPFAFKRHLDLDTYEFNKGFGSKINYLFSLNKSFEIGCETGFWYMWNNTPNFDASKGNYITKNYLTPLMLVIYCKPISTSNVYLCMKGGYVNLQKVHEFTDNLKIKNSRWTSIFEFSFGFSFGRNKKYKAALDFGDTFIEKKCLRSFETDLKSFYF